MAVRKDFAYAYGWNTYYQILLGISSETSEGLIAKQRAWAWTVLIIVCIWMPQTASLLILWGDFTSIITCLSTNVSMTISIAKLMVLQCHRRVIGSILDAIAEDWVRLTSNEDAVIMLDTARTSRFISIMSVSLTNVMFITYIISQVWSTLTVGRDPNVDPRLAFGFLHNAYFPFDTTNPVIFVPIWIGQFFCTLISMASYSGPDCIVSMMVLHLCGQLTIVRHSLKNLVDETTMREPKKYWKTLIPIVKRHEELNQLSLVIKETFGSILLVQMLASSISFCFQGYAVFTTFMDRSETELPVLDLAFCTLLAIYTMIHLFIYCYVGDKLLVESTSIASDFYKTAWYNLLPSEARAILFVCHRSNIPLEVKAGKFCTFNLELFNAIMKNSMGYLSMLMAMKDRLK